MLIVRVHSSLIRDSSCWSMELNTLHSRVGIT